MRYLLALALLGALPGIAAEKVANYDENTLAFGPEGQSIDLYLKFRDDFVKKIRSNLAGDHLTLYLREDGYCLMEEDGCESKSTKEPFCLVSIERRGFGGPQLLDSEKEFGPMENAFPGTYSKVVNGKIRQFGTHSHEWRFHDPETSADWVFRCSAGAGHEDTELTKNLFQRIIGNYMKVDFAEKKAMETMPQVAPDKKSTSKPTKKKH